MPWQLEREEAFESSIKALRKRFPNVERDILGEFKNGPPQTSTDPLPAFGRKLWKGRAPASDLNRGKSKGFRIIYYWDQELPNWCCLGIAYFKGDKANLTASELDRLFVSFKAKLDKCKESVDELEKRVSCQTDEHKLVE